jgi:predicted amidohydrolase YtcJ
LESHRVKLFADGALGAQTASLSKPYVEVPHRCAGIHGKHAADHEHNDDGGAAAAVASSSSDAASSSSSPNYGLLIHTSAALKDKVSFAHSKGWRLEVHVIGDRAAEEALAAFESSGITAKDRPIMTHCQVLREDLVERMRAIGAIADVQPQFSVTDSKWASERLPDELLQWSYCWRTLLKRGVHVAGGSDAPIEVANPLLGMHAAIFRPVQQYDLDQTGGQAKQSKETEQPLPPITPDQRWRPSECLSVRESLALYTTGAAYAAGRENELGVLRRGFWADFTVLDRDVVQNPLELVRARVEQVYVAGLRKK